jgi:hypothetical protein
MVESFGAEYVSLHVREGNVAAIHLYRKTLKYQYVLWCDGALWRGDSLLTGSVLCCCRVYDIEKGYYADGEDAYDMRMPFTDKCNQAFASQVNRFKKVLAEKDAEKAAKDAKEAEEASA